MSGFSVGVVQFGEVTVTVVEPGRIIVDVAAAGRPGVQGERGENFAVDETGSLAGRIAFDAAPKGFSYMDVDAGNIYFKRSATSGDWSDPIPFGRGEAGADGEDGADGLGWTSGSYNPANGVITFSSTDGLGFATGDLRGADGDDGSNGSDGLGWTGGSYNAGTGVIMFTSADGLGFATGDIRGSDGLEGADGSDGADGDNGWSPVLAAVSDGARRVFQVSDWVGGEGTKPATGGYLAASGFVVGIGDALDVRGPQGATGAAGAGSGDMIAADYDPHNIAGDAFARANHTGTQAAGTITGLATVATTGDYADLSGKPTLGTAAAAATTDFATGAEGDLAASAVQPGDLATVATSGAYSDLSGLPSLGTASVKNVGYFATASHTHTLAAITGAGTAASLNVPASGNAASGEVVKGSDTRLTDSRTPTTHTHTKSQITDFPTLGTASAQDVGYFATAAQGALVDTALQPGAQIPWTDVTGKPTLFDGAYASLSGKPTLGTAAAAATGDFATAAQGANGATAYSWGNHAAAGYLTAIADGAVTNAKLDDMVTARIKGRVTGSTGDPEDLTGAQALSIIGTSTAGEIAALTGTKPVVPTAVATLFTRATPSGGSNYAPNFATTRIATWIPNANRVFIMPVNAVPGATIEVKLYASSSTERTVTFGSYYVGDLPTLLITNTVKYSVFIYCVSATEFVVTARRLQ